MEINMNNYENIARIKELTSLLNKYRDKYYNYSFECEHYIVSTNMGAKQSI